MDRMRVEPFPVSQHYVLQASHAFDERSFRVRHDAATVKRKRIHTERTSPVEKGFQRGLTDRCLDERGSAQTARTAEQKMMPGQIVGHETECDLLFRVQAERSRQFRVHFALCEWRRLHFAVMISEKACWVKCQWGIFDENVYFVENRTLQRCNVQNRLKKP